MEYFQYSLCNFIKLVSQKTKAL